MVVIDGIGPNLDLMLETMAARIEVAMQHGKEKVEGYAKENAPWDDRTGDARQGLTADLSEDNGEIVLTLAHSVEYGVWLETIEDGNFAIIMPTLEALGPEILHEAGAVVMEVRRGV